METQHLPQKEIIGDIYWDKITQKINIKIIRNELMKFNNIKKKHTDDDIIKFALSYTLQSL